MIRSLGRSGYSVHACSSVETAIGLSSSYACKKVVCPNSDSPHFVGWVMDYVREYNIRAIVPSESFMLAVRSNYDEFSHLLPYYKDKSEAYIKFSKADTFDLLLGFGGKVSQNIPRTLIVEGQISPDVLDVLRSFREPIYVKVDACYDKMGRSGGVLKLKKGDDISNILVGLADRYSKFVVQEHVDGVGVGVFVFRRKGVVAARFMHIRLNEVPYSGGVSSYRKSFYHEGILADAIDKINSLNWDGVAMLEYRWESGTGSFALMEINARFWGSLHLAIYAGVDFPLLLMDSFFGIGGDNRVFNWKDIRCRHTFPLDIGHLKSILKAPGIAPTAKVAKCLEFLWLFLDVRVKADLWFPGDRALYWSNFINYVRSKF